jgi:HAD superfamily hydrolase (TIGR01509 family)
MMNDSQKLSAVAFDLDGLIVNSEDVYELADVEVLRRRGKVYEDALRQQMMGRQTAESLRLMIEHHDLDDTPDQLDSERTALRDKFLEASIAPMAGLLELLLALAAAKIPAGVATSGTRDYAAYVLGRLEIRSAFEFVLTAENVTNGKPAPDVYQLAASKFGILPSHMMVLEDSANGCQAGVAAGAFTVAVPNRHTERNEFAGVQFVANTLADRRIYQALGIAN